MKYKILIMAAVSATGCACAGGPNGSTPSVAATTAPVASPSSGTNYAAAYKAVRWGSNVTVSFTGSCSMTFGTNGEPFEKAAYYLAPAGAQQTAVATTPSGQPLAVIAAPSTATGASFTLNVCPSKAAQTASTNLGPIGYTIDGEAIFNPYEANGTTAALADNASYAFSANGMQEIASFIDSCNSHAAGMGGSALWHYHGVPTCLTQQLDGTGASHILGFALDGFPIYGGRDIDGNVVAVSQLDACNGITSPTPEFPKGAYHYVLPIGVTGNQSSLNCYAGTPVASH